MDFDLIHDYALSLSGTPYLWGGNGPAFDCSGLCIELLRASGIGPPHDMNAQQLFEHYKPKSMWDAKERGALAFYGQSTGQITHVGFMLSNTHIIEAGGGGHRVRSAEMAQANGAFVRIRLLYDRSGYSGRKDLVATMLPKYL